MIREVICVAVFISGMAGAYWIGVYAPIVHSFMAAMLVMIASAMAVAGLLSVRDERSGRGA